MLIFQETFDLRDSYTETVIIYQIAQKRLNAYPFSTQDEVDQMALAIRKESKSNIAEMKRLLDEILLKTSAAQENELGEIGDLYNLKREHELSQETLAIFIQVNQILTVV